MRELARRAAVHLRAMQLTAARLESAGVVYRVGTGAHQKMRFRDTHPLAPAILALFKAERDRADRVLRALRKLARTLRAADAVWLQAAGDQPGGATDTLTIGVLAPAATVDALVDGMRADLTPLLLAEDQVVEVEAWTRPDLEARRPDLSGAMLLSGALPATRDGHGSGRIARRTHARADQELLDRGREAAATLLRRPELRKQALLEVRERLVNAPPQDARTLREWEQLLATTSAVRLRRFLVDTGERAIRLRQSMPLALLRGQQSLAPSPRS